VKHVCTKVELTHLKLPCPQSCPTTKHIHMIVPVTGAYSGSIHGLSTTSGDHRPKHAARRPRSIAAYFIDSLRHGTKHSAGIAARSSRSDGTTPVLSSSSSASVVVVDGVSMARAERVVVVVVVVAEDDVRLDAARTVATRRARREYEEDVATAETARSTGRLDVAPAPTPTTEDARESVVAAVIMPCRRASRAASTTRAASGQGRGFESRVERGASRGVPASRPR